MRLFDRQGRARERVLVITSLRGSGTRGDRELVRFLSPGDIKGTALLVWEHPGPKTSASSSSPPLVVFAASRAPKNRKASSAAT